jgi:hypothetical protein
MMFGVPSLLAAAVLATPLLALPLLPTENPNRAPHPTQVVSRATHAHPADTAVAADSGARRHGPVVVSLKQP